MQGTPRKVNPLPSHIAPPPSARRANLAAVLARAWDVDIVTASDLMPMVGLTRSTTIDVIEELVEAKLLRELPNARAGGEYRKGRPARRFELRVDGAAVVGVDAGRSHLTVAVADLRGTIVSLHHHVHDHPLDDVGERRLVVANAIDTALASSSLSRADVVGMCVGVPAPVDRSGSSPDNPDGFWQRMNPGFAAQFGEWVPLVRVENDASLAAVAERSVGSATGLHDFVALLAGERLGAGVVVDGALLRGARGGVGEMIALDYVDGVHGAWGLGHRAAEWALDERRGGTISPTSVLARVPESTVNAKVVMDAARAGDPDAQRIVARLAAVLARVTGVLGSLYDPETVIVSGAIADGATELIAQARSAQVNDGDLPRPTLVASTLGGDVVCIGAVSAAVELVRNGILDLPPNARGPLSIDAPA